MNKTKQLQMTSDKKLSIVNGILILVGAIISVCLVFFFIQLFKAQSESIKPTVFDAQQIGATDSSVLLAWSNSEPAKEFIVRYRRTDSKETSEFRTDKSFAAIHGLDPLTRYKALIIPVFNDTEYDPVPVICNTSPYCRVTEVITENITESGAHLSWKYDGINEGFTIAVYAVGKDGKRHMTSEIKTIPKDFPCECTLEGLLSEIQYTVCVMPNTRYAQVNKSNFTTEKNSNLYRKYTVVRFVIASLDSPNPMNVNVMNTLEADKEYQTSLILSGTADQTKTVNMAIYITDQENNIVSHHSLDSVFLNPDGKSNYFYRSYSMNFKAPSEPGDYTVFAVIDGVTVKKKAFKVN